MSMELYRSIPVHKTKEEQGRKTKKKTSSKTAVAYSSRNTQSSSFLRFGARHAPAMFQIGAIHVTLDRPMLYISKYRRGTSNGQLKLNCIQNCI
jgi:hypothetical protein